MLFVHIRSLRILSILIKYFSQRTFLSPGFSFFLKRRKFYQVDTIFLMKILKPSYLYVWQFLMWYFVKRSPLWKWNLIENSRVYFFFSSSCRLCKAFGDIFFFFFPLLFLQQFAPRGCAVSRRYYLEESIFGGFS